MLQAPDFFDKQILFLPVWGEEKGRVGLKVHNENLVFTRDGKCVNQVSLHRLFAVFVIGDLSITTPLLTKARERGVSIFFVGQNLKPKVAMVAGAEGHFLLRQRQYTLPQEEALRISRHIVANKITNQFRALGVPLRSNEVREALAGVYATSDLQELLGYEGSVSRRYFRELFQEIDWRRRAPRTREDVPNLLLDIGYSMLFNFLDALLAIHGFDTYRGVYHQLFFARKSLVADIQEPFRPLIDRTLLKAYRQRRIRLEDFSFNKRSGEFFLPWKASPHYYRIFSEVIMEHKMDIFSYVRGFYRHIMRPDTYPMPEFRLPRTQPASGAPVEQSG